MKEDFKSEQNKMRELTSPASVGLLQEWKIRVGAKECVNWRGV